MHSSFPLPVFRTLFFALLATAGLLTSACKKETPSDEEQIKKFIADNNITNAQRQLSGLYYVPVVSNPAGTKVGVNRTVSVLYTGALLDGTVFDASSRHGNTPFPFVVGKGQVIAGWEEGISLMRKGEKAQLLIPSSLGYGARGYGSSIPPNAALRFEVEVTDVQ